ncbi:Hypothetical predicted protein, partial [Mytilus galloprovincialis]
MGPIIGKSVKLKCSTNIEVGKWLIYISDKNMTRDLLVSDASLTNKYSDKKYNVSINESNDLELEIKVCSVDDVTVYVCICSDEINKKNYQDQIDLRDYFIVDMLDSEDNKRAHNESGNSDENDTSHNETIMLGIITVIVVALVLTAACVVYIRLQFMFGRHSLYKGPVQTVTNYILNNQNLSRSEPNHHKHKKVYPDPRQDHHRHTQ